MFSTQDEIWYGAVSGGSTFGFFEKSEDEKYEKLYNFMSGLYDARNLNKSKKKLKQIKLVQYDLKGGFANNRVRHSQQWGDDELKRGGSTKSEKTLNVSTNHNDVCIEGTSLSPVPT